MIADWCRWLLVLMVGLCLTGPLRAQEDHALNDGGRYAVFDQFNALEIALGRAAGERGLSEQVRSLARQIATDQEVMQVQGRELGLRLNIFVGPPANPLGSYGVTLANLLAKPAAEFDSAYLKQELVFQRNVIDALTRMLPGVREPGLAAFFREASERFERHRSATEVLAKQLAVE